MKSIKRIITAWLIVCLVYTSTSVPYQVQAATVGKVTGVYTSETLYKESDRFAIPQLHWKSTKNASGYQLRIYNVATGKKIGKNITVKQSSYLYADMPAIPDITFCKIQIRAYQLSNNKKSYGSWYTLYHSWDRFWNGKDHHITVKRSANSAKLTTSWDKVAGATNYTVTLIVPDTSTPKYYREYKVGNTTKTHMSFTKVGSYKLIKNEDYSVYVTPNYTFKDKTYKGENIWYNPT